MALSCKNSWIDDMRCNVINQSFSFFLIQSFVEKNATLGEIILIRRIVSAHIGMVYSEFAFGIFLNVISRSTKRIGIVIRASFLVSINCHWAVSLIALGLCTVGTIDWDLQIICTQAVTMGVGIREQSSLQHFIRARFNSGHQMGRAKSQLFNFSKIISWIAIECQFSSLNQRKFTMGPYFGQIKWVEFPIFSFLKTHDLNVHCVRGIISLSNGVVQITNSEIWIISSHIVSLLAIEGFDPLIRFVMKLDINSFILSVHHFESV